MLLKKSPSGYVRWNLIGSPGWLGTLSAMTTPSDVTIGPRGRLMSRSVWRWLRTSALSDSARRTWITFSWTNSTR